MIKYPDRTALAAGVADLLADQLRRALTKGPATLVVPGGSTPGPVFDQLAQVDLDWARVAVMLSDERWVPGGDARSNTRLIKERLLMGPAAAAQYLPLYTPAEVPEEVFEELNAVIAPHLPVTVALLGMGADMHTASLFPGGDKLALGLSADAPVLVAMRPTGLEPRVTLSARVLNAAKEKHVIITGDEKRTAYMRAQDFPPSQAPISAIQNLTVHWAA